MERVSDLEHAQNRKLRKQVAELERWRAALERRLDFLERSRERLEGAVEAAPIALVGFDALGVIQLWNRAAEALLGFSARQVVGNSVACLDTELSPLIGKAITQVLGGELVSGLELQREWKTGALTLRLSGRPLLTPAGVLRGGVLVIGARAPAVAAGESAEPALPLDESPLSVHGS